LGEQRIKDQLWNIHDNEISSSTMVVANVGNIISLLVSACLFTAAAMTKCDGCSWAAYVYRLVETNFPAHYDLISCRSH
jgi:hypothetical protein